MSFTHSIPKTPPQAPRSLHPATTRQPLQELIRRALSLCRFAQHRFEARLKYLLFSSLGAQPRPVPRHRLAPLFSFRLGRNEQAIRHVSKLSSTWAASVRRWHVQMTSGEAQRRKCHANSIIAEGFAVAAALAVVIEISWAKLGMQSSSACRVVLMHGTLRSESTTQPFEVHATHQPRATYGTSGSPMSASPARAL
jgi:hypothetical protein